MYSGTAWQVLEAIVPLLCAIFFWKISTNWVYFYLIGVVGELFSLISSYFVLPESPRFSLEIGNFEELETTLTQIAQWNRKDLNWQSLGFNQDQTRVVRATKSEADGQKEESNAPSLRYWLGQRSICINLVIMSILWLSCCFNFFMMGFMVNTFEQVYISGIASSSADIFAYVTSGYLYKLLGMKRMIFGANALAVLGGTLILTYGLERQDQFSWPLLILVAKIGTAAAFNVVFIGHAQTFPVLFVATSFSFCNLMARGFTAISPIMA